MLLIGVCSLSAGDVTLLPSWIRVAILVVWVVFVWLELGNEMDYA